MSGQEHAMPCPTCGSTRAAAEADRVPKKEISAYEGRMIRLRLEAEGGPLAPIPGSAVPIFHVLCDAGVIDCDMSPKDEDNDTRLSLNMLVYFAKHRFGCPGLERYVFDWSAVSTFSMKLEHDFDDMKGFHSEPAQEWDRKAEFVEFARKHGNDVEWLQIASAICYIDDEMMKDSVTLTREEMIDEACQWYIFHPEAVPGVYDDIADMLARTRGGAQPRAPDTA